MKELESLKSIFKDRIFKIPDYQRGYAWSEKQLVDFWEDIVSLPFDRYHYTGLLSLKMVDRTVWNFWTEDKWLLEERGCKPFHIVDGQQRLTTFVVFIQAISEILRTLPENYEKNDDEIYLGTFSLKNIKEEYLVVQRPPQNIISSYKFGYEVDNPSFKYLKHRIFNEPDSGTVQETFYTLNLENAKSFFEENLRLVYAKKGIAEIEILFKKLTQNLMFNVYEISDDFDVFVAFETMNNRGKKLSNLELLKNRLIYLTTLYEDHELNPEERITLREKINDSWKEIYYQLGRNKKNPLNDDDFLVAHWIMYFQYSREKGDDYIRFLLDKMFTPQNIYDKVEIKKDSLVDVKEIRDAEDDQEDDIPEAKDKPTKRSKLTPKEIEDYANSLKATALHWYNTYNPINNPDLTSEESLWIDRLNRIGIIYFRPLITASFLPKEIDSKQRAELFKQVERFIFITFRLSRAFSTYRNSEFYKITRQLRRNELSIPQIIARLHERMGYSFQVFQNGEICFDHSDFLKYIDRKFRTGVGFYNWNALRYFLYEYEMEKVRARGNNKIDWKLFVKGEKDRVSVEHIYPQTPDSVNWSPDFEKHKANQLYLQHSLGNLLPLSQSINSSLQNDSFENKKKPKFNDRGEKVRQGYLDGSHSEIEVASYTEWTPETILERGMDLLAFMEKRWEFKFINDEAKKQLLFLNFMMQKENEEIINETESLN